MPDDFLHWCATRGKKLCEETLPWTTLSVMIWVNDVEVGMITWDKERFHIEGDKNLLQQLLDTPIEDFERRRRETPITFEDYKRLVEKRIPMLTSRDNPERWLRQLYHHEFPNGVEAGPPWPDMVELPHERET